ncbi:MAG: glycosyltransferase [Candidatus Sericytochromatia bacterium]|nr:glycosyltransferase [Candidatus Sericytochromatia bacterium]
MARKRVMVLYETAGGGHLANARAIHAAMAERHPHVDVELVHLADELGSQRIRAVFSSYNALLKSDPRLVKVGFKFINRLDLEPLVYRVFTKARRNLQESIRRHRPDLIVSVFGVGNTATPMALEHVGWRHRVPFLVFCTDMTTDFLRGWVSDEADGMVALTPDAAGQLVAYGYPADRILTLPGLPVHPAFIHQEGDQQSSRQEFGLDPDKFTVLVTMGGVAVRNAWRVSRVLAATELPIQVIVACGRNGMLERKVRRLAERAGPSFKVMGHTDRMASLMRASDLIVAKPGPGTIAEAIQMARPLLIDASREAMPQEKGNLEYLIARGLCEPILEMDALPKMIRRHIEDPDLHAKAVDRLVQARRPEAILQLVDWIVSRIPERGQTRPLDSAAVEG